MTSQIRIIQIIGVFVALAMTVAPGCAGRRRSTDAAGEHQTAALSPEILGAIRQGAASFEMPPTGIDVPLVGRPELPLVEALLNGHGPYRLLVDLGSNVCIFRRDVINSVGGVVLVDRDTTDIVTLRELRIGKAKWSNVVGGAYDELDVDGVIGYNILASVTTSIDVPAQRFALSDDPLPPPDGAEILPFIVEGRMPYVEVAVGDSTLLMNIDTGASGQVFLPSAWVSRFNFSRGPTPGPALHNNQSGTVRAEIGRLDGRLQIGRWTVPDPLVMLDSEIDDAFFGMAFFTDAQVTLDGPNHRISIHRPGGDLWPIPDYVTHGVSLQKRGADWTVSDVIPETTAQELQISVGDKVLAVNGIPAGSLTMDEWLEASSDPRPLVLEVLQAERRRMISLNAVELP